MKRSILAALAAVTLLTGTLRADSLYPVEGTNSLYTENRARRVGDVITILIQETTDATQSAGSQNQKNSNLSVGAGVGSWGTGSANMPVNQAGLGGQSYSQGQGTSTRSAKVVGQMTAKITRVLPSGNYMVEGTRYVEVNEDKQIIEVAGEIRPGDITSDNTVTSSRVANARIKVTGSGPASESARPGLLTRLFSWLMVF
jgi:flagellar L-ring protein precursor FlgH